MLRITWGSSLCKTGNGWESRTRESPPPASSDRDPPQRPGWRGQRVPAIPIAKPVSHTGEFAAGHPYTANRTLHPQRDGTECPVACGWSASVERLRAAGSLTRRARVTAVAMRGETA